MKLSDIFNQLTYGELKQLGIGGFAKGAIQPDDYREVVNHLNLGLVNLYQRFPIKENVFYLRTVEGRTIYEISKAYAKTYNSTDYHIVDEPTNPFMDDVLRINDVFDDMGEPIPVNDRNDEMSIFTSSYNSVQIPWATGNELLAFTYRAEPKQISVPTSTSALDLTQNVDLPDVLMECILSYVEYRTHKSRGGELGIAQANIAKVNYEAMCMDIDKRNILRNANNTTNLKAFNNGWR